MNLYVNMYYYQQEITGKFLKICIQKVDRQLLLQHSQCFISWEHGFARK